jgi:FAD dependent oxidoreductase
MNAFAGDLPRYGSGPFDVVVVGSGSAGSSAAIAARFDDSIGLCGAPIEDHQGGTDTDWQYLPDGQAVEIPYRSLVVRDATNVLVAGRCFSATHDAHASVRSMAQCMAMGQAAGTAAAMAAAADVDPREVPTEALRNRLAGDGAILRLAESVRAE